MKVDTDTVDDLSKIVELKTQEIKYWRSLIDRHAEGHNQLKQFQSLFNDTEKKFDRFKKMISKNNDTADILETKLNRTLADRSKNIDNLRNDILNLKRSIENQTAENEKLEKELKEDAEKLGKLKCTEGLSNLHLNSSSSTTETHDPFIQRLPLK